MFPLLDLDDDALAATLGFSDPRTLCAITMACRRLRILADGAWAVLNRNLPEDLREGGTTFRERVLSSFVVHERKSWIEDIAATDPKAAGLEIFTHETFKTENPLLYIHMTDHTENLVGSFFLNASDEGLRALADKNGSIEVPIEKEELTGQLKEFVQRYNLNVPLLLHQRGPMTFMVEVAKHVFSNLGTTIIAINRRTLKRYVFFQGDQPSDSYNAFLPRVVFSRKSEARRVDIAGARNWVMTSSDGAYGVLRSLKLQFYLQGNEFGIMFSNSWKTL